MTGWTKGPDGRLVPCERDADGFWRTSDGVVVTRPVFLTEAEAVAGKHKKRRKRRTKVSRTHAARTHKKED